MDELGRIRPDEYRQKHSIGPVVILDNVRSAYNVGSVFRTADAFGISHVYLCGITCQIDHREVRKTALGAEQSIPSTHTSDSISIVEKLKSNGYIILAVEQTHNSENLHEYPFKPDQQYALIFGNEVEGVSDELLLLADTHIEIPQTGSKHSLNLANAASIVLWEISKLRIPRSKDKKV